MSLVTPFDFPLAAGSVTTLRDALDKLLRDYSADGKAKLMALSLNSNTQVVMIVGPPQQMQEIIFKAITPLVQPGIIAKGS